MRGAAGRQQLSPALRAYRGVGGRPAASPRPREEEEGAPGGRRGNGPARSLFDGAEAGDGLRMERQEKLQFVTEVFDRIAGHYDALNWVVSLGQTQLFRWWHLAPELAGLERGAAVLDVGCGPGNVGRLVRGLYGRPQFRLKGVDPSREMVARARAQDPASQYEVGDVCALAEPDGTFECVVTVYTLRNFPDLELGLREMIRVLKPGGKLLILDAFPPPHGWMRRLLHLWLDRAVPCLAGLFVDPRPYAWLAASVQGTRPPEDVAALLRRHGCSDVRVRPYAFGAFAGLTALKDWR